MEVNKYDVFKLKKKQNSLGINNGSVIIVSSDVANSKGNFVTVASRVKFINGYIVTYVIPKSDLDLKVSRLNCEERCRLDILLKNSMGIK